MAEAFEAIEPGAGAQLHAFLKEAKVKYDIGMGRFVNKPAHNALEFARLDILRDAPRLQLLRSFSDHVRRHFKDPRLVELMEFPVLFLGSKPQNTPALYSLMNYADTALGTWYPMGGMHRIVDGMVKVAEEQGVRFEYNCQVEGIVEENGQTAGLRVGGALIRCPQVIAACDYHHAEQHLMPKRFRRYDAAYWDQREMSPSSLLFYLGIDRRIPGLKHHTLFFDTSFDAHAEEIYDAPAWPKIRCSMSAPPVSPTPAWLQKGAKTSSCWCRPPRAWTKTREHATASTAKSWTDWRPEPASPFASMSSTNGSMPTANLSPTTAPSRATPMAWPTPCGRRHSGSPN